ncbi:MAG: hypothetical protein WCG02_03405 [Candidatus Taylorbacteria bacterium]
MTPKIYFESKKIMYGIVLSLLLLLLILSFIYASPLDSLFASLIIIVCVMVVGVYLYPTATFSIYEDHLEFKKGSQKISVPWSGVLNIHKEPVFATDIISYYLAKRYYMGGAFLETTQGYSKYFAPQLIRSKNGPATFKDLEKEIESRSVAHMQEGQVSIFKQKSKLFDVVFIIAAIFLIPVIIILLYGLFTGTVSESVQMLKDLLLLS